MQYGTFRSMNLFIGSGVIEAGCRSLIGKRCKQSGMFRSDGGAEKVLAFRCIHASHNTDDFWKHRLNSRLAELGLKSWAERRWLPVEKLA
jgi:hypothetical protein